MKGRLSEDEKKLFEKAASLEDLKRINQRVV
jgi:uncharacterized protein (DUF1778 family)